MSTSVLVAGSGNVTGMHVVRSLVEFVCVVGVDSTAANPANALCQNYVVPRASDPMYVSVLSDIIQRQSVTHIVASNDHEARALAENRWLLPPVCINGLGANTLVFLDKEKTHQLFKDKGILTPDVLDVHTTSLPFVVRKARMGSGKKFVHIVRTREDYAELPHNIWDSGVVTRFIEGNEYTVDVLCDQTCRPVSIVPRLRHEVQHGMVRFAEIVNNQVVIDATRELAQKCCLVGMNCVQCILTKDNECYFIEVNPRPGSGLDLTIAAGVNMPLLWWKLSQGISVDVHDPEWGLKMVRNHGAYIFR